MSIPHDEIIQDELLLLLNLQKDGTMECNEIYKILATKFPELTREELEQPYQNSKSKWANRVQFARLHCVTKGYIYEFAKSKRRGYWTITNLGREYVQSMYIPSPISERRVIISSKPVIIDGYKTVQSPETPFLEEAKQPIANKRPIEQPVEPSLFEEMQQLVTDEEKRDTEEPWFELASEEDARDYVVTSIVRRRGQPIFRRKLLNAYNRKCAISGVDVDAVLEASHIIPYNGEQTNEVNNGLLLRSDIHAIFDFGLLTIEPDTFIILVSPLLKGTEYFQYHGKKLFLPTKKEDWPSSNALTVHYKKSRL